MLIFMVRSEDSQIHYEAVGVIGNLVHSSQHIKKKVLEEGALQPVIGLLSSRCPDSQREAALLLGQFATYRPEPPTNDPDYKAKIVQRGAVQPGAPGAHGRAACGRSNPALPLLVSGVDCSARGEETHCVHCLRLHGQPRVPSRRAAAGACLSVAAAVGGSAPCRRCICHRFFARRRC